jgi:hypothetical protein
MKRFIRPFPVTCRNNRKPILFPCNYLVKGLCGIDAKECDAKELR